MNKAIIVGLIIILGMLEYRFIFSQDSIFRVRKIKAAIAQQELELLNLQTRNQDLLTKIEFLKQSPLAIEEQARYELGLIKPEEKYYQIVEPIK